MRTVLVFGTFDLLHQGHKSFLNQARKHGDRLVVVVGRDRNVTAFKKRAPVQDERTRLETLTKLEQVDKAMLGRLDHDYMKIIDKLRPGVICLGYDQDSLGLEAALAKHSPGTMVLRMRPYKEREFKTSILRQRLGA